MVFGGTHICHWQAELEDLPSVGQLHVDMTLQQHSEQVDIVVPGLTALLQSWLCRCIQMPVTHFLQIKMNNVSSDGTSLIHVHYPATDQTQGLFRCTHASQSTSTHAFVSTACSLQRSGARCKAICMLPHQLNRGFMSTLAQSWSQQQVIPVGLHAS